jgi:hypothetical protein
MIKQSLMQVRVSPVKNWFTRGYTQRSFLVLHYHPAGAAKPKQLQIAGWGGVEFTSLSEKLAVAHAINSATADTSSSLSAEERC